ncbi:DUF2281 domain-containing protein [Prosthecobacter sp.]|uniref:DUF2281 domain-containing protein n=1 Tax=Prosthecobacter sp. TaxID=1965333 RepID=UPI0024899DBE|nr:DUF2281 domain-containing protein [Prosthecobacter sp.]MDI1313767.1 DUF2281 domain-containing protein [Prosthecobacter sp.]
MTIQQLIISEVAHQPEPLLRELWHYLKFLKSTSDETTPVSQPVIRKGYGSVPGIVLADDFDSPLAEFADYRP